MGHQFIRTIVPTDGYAEVKQVGNKYIVHLDREDIGDGMTSCYECMVSGEPDIASLTQELQGYKEKMAARELEIAKKVRIQELMSYDGSSAVNEFYFAGTGMWLDKATRVGLLLRLDAEKKMGKETTTLWFGTKGFTLGIDIAFTILYTIEGYASSCYDKTAEHAAAIEGLQSKADVEDYDFTVGYPEKLDFNNMTL